MGRIDLATGATLWALETPATATATFSDVAASASRVMVIGTTCGSHLDSACEHAAWTSPASGGALAVSALTARTSTAGGAVTQDIDQTFAVASGWGLQGPQVLLRTLANASGAVVQNSVSPFAIGAVPYADLGWTADHVLQVSPLIGGHLLATYTTNALPPSGSVINATLLKINRATGVIAWQKFFLELDRMAVVSRPVVDSAGNVAISAVEHFGLFGLPDRRWVRKYAGADGSLVWEREFPVNPLSATDMYPPTITALGDDVGVHDAPIGSGHRRFTSLSGINGTTRWSLGSDDESVQSIGPNGVLARRGSVPLRLSRIDASTGASIWTTSLDAYPDSAHLIHGVQHGDDGDFYVGGAIRTSSGAPDPLRTMGSMLRLDGDDGHLVWFNRMESNPVWPTSRVNPRSMGDGKIYATQPLGGTMGYALTTFATNSGVPLGSSYLYSSSLEQPHRTQEAEQGVASVSTEFGTLVAGQHFAAGDPGTQVVSNLGSPMPTVAGALRIDLDVQPSSSGSSTRYELMLETHNEGSSSVEGVSVLLGLPPGAIIGTTTCTRAGSPCDATITATSIEGRFTIPAGASVRFAGSVVLPGGSDVSSPDRFNAHAFAPYPFMEANLEDNQANASFVDRIMDNGFEH